MPAGCTCWVRCCPLKAFTALSWFFQPSSSLNYPCTTRPVSDGDPIVCLKRHDRLARSHQEVSSLTSAATAGKRRPAALAQVGPLAAAGVAQQHVVPSSTQGSYAAHGEGAQQAGPAMVCCRGANQACRAPAGDADCKDAVPQVRRMAGTLTVTVSSRATPDTARTARPCCSGTRR